MNYSTVIWDWNGTLLDDLTLCVSILNRLLAAHGLAPVESVEKYREIFGFPISDYYKRAGFDFDKTPFDALAHEYMDMYTPESMTCGLIPHATDVLAELSGRGVNQIILSASKQENLDEQVDNYRVRGYFNELVGTRDIYGASKIDAGRAWLLRNNIDTANAVMIGDSEHDLEVADALGVSCILSSLGHRPRTALAATGKPVVDDLRDILK